MSTEWLACSPEAQSVSGPLQGVGHCRERAKSGARPCGKRQVAAQACWGAVSECWVGSGSRGFTEFWYCKTQVALPPLWCREGIWCPLQMWAGPGLFQRLCSSQADAELAGLAYMSLEVPL